MNMLYEKRRSFISSFITSERLYIRGTFEIINSKLLYEIQHLQQNKVFTDLFPFVWLMPNRNQCS